MSKIKGEETTPGSPAPPGPPTRFVTLVPSTPCWLSSLPAPLCAQVSFMRSADVCVQPDDTDARGHSSGAAGGFQPRDPPRSAFR